MGPPGALHAHLSLSRRQCDEPHPTAAGIQDAHNLAWKLAYVLGGNHLNTVAPEEPRAFAGPELLAMYTAERRPVAQASHSSISTRFTAQKEQSLSVSSESLCKASDCSSSPSWRACCCSTPFQGMAKVDLHVAQQADLICRQTLT